MCKDSASSREGRLASPFLFLLKWQLRRRSLQLPIFLLAVVAFCCGEHSFAIMFPERLQCDELHAGQQFSGDDVWAQRTTYDANTGAIGTPSATINGTGWTGAVTNGNANIGNWSNAANWDSTPPVVDERNLFFGQGYKNANGTNFIANNDLSNYFGWYITFENVTNPVSFTLQGNAITLDDFNSEVAKIYNLSSINQTLNFTGLQFGGSLGWAEINAVNGPLTFGSSNTISFSGAVAGIKFFFSGQSVTFNNTINGSGKWFALTGNTANTVNINGSATTGDFYLMNGGTLNLNSGGSLTTSGLRLGGDFGTTGNQDQTRGGTFALTSATGGQSFSSTINAVAGNTSGALLIDSRNTSGTNAISSQIFLDSDLRIQQASTNVFPNPATLLFQGGSFDIKNRTLTVSSGGGPFAGAAAVVTINETLGSSLASGGSLIKTGVGTLILQGTNNNYTGTDSSQLNPNGTQISGGTLGIYGDGSLGLVPASAYNNIQLTGSGTLQDTANNITLDAKRNIVLSGTGGLDSNGNFFTINGVISGSGDFLKIGVGTVKLDSPANTYSGSTIISGGTLEIAKLANSGSISSIGTGGTIFIGLNLFTSPPGPGPSPTLRYIGSGDSTNQLLILGYGPILDSSGTGPIAFTNTNVGTHNDPVTLTLTGSNMGANTLRGGINNGSGGFTANLIKDGSGQWVLTGTSSYTGSTTVKNGTLTVQNGSGSVGNLSNTSTITLQSGAILNLAGDPAVSDRLNNNATLTLTNGTLRLNSVPEGTTATPGLGALSLTSNTNAVLDLAGTSLLHIAASGSQIWTGTLSIWNWDGSFNGGALEQLLFGTADNSTSLTQTQLNQISFYSDAGLNLLGTARFSGLGNGEVVPAPEPTTTCLAVALGLLALVHHHRRRIRTVLGARRSASCFPESHHDGQHRGLREVLSR